MHTKFDDLFCQFVILRHCLEVAHWTVVGRHFFEWHHMYAQQYEILSEMIDDYAEMLIMKKIDFHPCLSHVAEKIEHKVHHHCCPIEKMRHLFNEANQVAGFMRTIANETKDIVVVDFMSSRLGKIEKMIWQYESILVCAKECHDQKQCCHQKECCNKKSCDSDRGHCS